MAQRLEQAALSFQDQLVWATKTSHKHAALIDADFHLERLKLYNRLAVQLRLSSVGQHEHLARQLDELGRLEAHGKGPAECVVFAAVEAGDGLGLPATSRFGCRGDSAVCAAARGTTNPGTRARRTGTTTIRRTGTTTLDFAACSHFGASCGPRAGCCRVKDPQPGVFRGDTLASRPAAGSMTPSAAEKSRRPGLASSTPGRARCFRRECRPAR